MHSRSSEGHRQSRKKKKLLTILILGSCLDLVCCYVAVKSAETESERVSWVASWVICNLRTGFSGAAVFNFRRTKRRETRMVDKEAKLRHQAWVIITPFGVLHYNCQGPRCAQEGGFGCLWLDGAPSPVEQWSRPRPAPELSATSKANAAAAELPTLC